MNKQCSSTVALILSLLLAPLNLFAHQEEIDLSKEILHLAQQGDPEAQFSMGIRYDLGFGVDRDPKEAAQWFTQAAQQGIVGAYIYLGIKYEFGSGIPQDRDLAKNWYHRAAQHGWPQAAYLLGNAHLHNPQPDQVLGCAWLTLAVEQEYLGAQEALEDYCATLTASEHEAVDRTRRILVEELRAAK